MLSTELKSERLHFLGTHATFWKRRWRLFKKDNYRWWHLGQPLWFWDQNGVYGMTLYLWTIISIKNLYSNLSWECQVGCLFEFWELFLEIILKRATLNSDFYTDIVIILKRELKVLGFKTTHFSTWQLQSLGITQKEKSNKREFSARIFSDPQWLLLISTCSYI